MVVLVSIYTNYINKFLDINECTKNLSPCVSSEAKCVNLEGGYKCERECPNGFEASLNGDCVDVNECLLGKFKCDKGMDCLNTEGSLFNVLK
jgi:hypothetical protein